MQQDLHVEGAHMQVCFYVLVEIFVLCWKSGLFSLQTVVYSFEEAPAVENAGCGERNGVGHPHSGGVHP